MALYWIGDIQGCDRALSQLLAEIDFSPSRDTAYVLGDLINRGENNVGVLRRLAQLGASAQCLLGNHDLHFLAVAQGVRALKRGDTVQDILQAPDRNACVEWLRHQHLALFAHDILMVHAGVLPQWSAAQTVALAREVETVLQSPDWSAFLPFMYGKEPHTWTDTLRGTDRLRVIINALTRLRFCTPQAEMEFESKKGLEDAPTGFLPWFDIPQRQTAGHVVAFGHWSTLPWLDRPDVWNLDSGCIWGGCLTALRWDPATRTHERISVRCQAAADPSKLG